MGIQEPDFNLKTKMDDHALEQVPENERKSWIQLSNNTMGICSTILIMLFGALATFTAGLWFGLLAGIISLILGTIFGSLLGNIAQREGLSSTVLTRYYGFGIKGSVVSSLVFCFMILGMLALENALLYHGVLFFFKLKPSIPNAILIYGIFTLCWILLSLFGIKIVYRMASIAIFGFLIVLVYILVNAIFFGDNSVGDFLSFGPQFSAKVGTSEFIAAINILIGATGALTLVTADSSRYARTKKDVILTSLFGNLMQNIVILLAGGIVAYVGIGYVVEYYMTNDGMTSAQAHAIAFDDMASFFIILGGIVGFILMFLANGKAQVLNTYSGSLALTNLFAAIGWKGNRAIFVVLANIVALIMIYFNILSLVESWLDALGVLTTSMATIIIVDFYFVKKRIPLNNNEKSIETINIAGILTLILSSILSLYLSYAKIFPIPVLASIVLSIILYPLLRLFIFKRKSVMNQITDQDINS
ncbi:purine-cytosine permease family protein [Bacillus massiliigorillae]|uniref:purine-cytosine permease family protein n=1 Tax=Bacillus massiliigorillae TaxID=1243664 RepID=UPI0003A295B1|nr:cytosine permease [Bacillus massiliigorillae]